MNSKERNNMNKLAFARFAMLYASLKEYEDGKYEMTGDITFPYNNCTFQLPSGRLGTVLAVALEMHLFQSALYMIENAKDLQLDLEKVSWSKDRKQILNAREVFEFASSYFFNKKLEEDDELCKNLPKIRKQINNNIDASVKIAEVLIKKI